MNYSEAMLQVMLGAKVRRNCWKHILILSNSYIFKRKNCKQAIGNRESSVAYNPKRYTYFGINRPNDRDATDWEIVP